MRELALLVQLAAPAPVDSLEAREQLRRCVEQPKQAGIDACRKALELGLSNERAAIAQLVLARKLARLGRHDEVVAAYGELVKLRPQDAEAHLRLGEALLVAGRAEDALARLREAIRLKPGDASAHGALGNALNTLGRHAEAVAAFEEADKVEPGFLESRPATKAAYEASRRGQRWP